MRIQDAAAQLRAVADAVPVNAFLAIGGEFQNLTNTVYAVLGNDDPVSQQCYSAEQAFGEVISTLEIVQATINRVADRHTGLSTEA